MDVQDILNALQGQRNAALDALANAMADNARLARELAAAKEEIEKLSSLVTEAHAE